MPIEPDRAMAARFEPVSLAWTSDDVIRYHLALGAGAPRCDGPELRYIFEDVLDVLGTFAALPASAAATAATEAPGLDYDLRGLVHGEQDVELFRALPAGCESLNRARVSAVYDKGEAAVLEIAVDTELPGGEPLARNTFRLLVPGAGGFGGEAGPKRARDVGTSAPDARFRVGTLPQQAAWYRMSGDRTPLHIDPALARSVGFLRAPLQGLCTWAMVAKALVDHELDGNIPSMAGFGARFSGPVYPGETLAVSVWRGESEHAVHATVVERDAPALSHGRFRFTGR
jgi:acyl dehydratase